MTTPISSGSLGNQTAYPAGEITQREQVDRAIRQMVDSEAEASSSPRQEDLVKPVQQINESLRPYGVEFDLHAEDGRVITRLVDRETGDVIRQIPPEETLRIAGRVNELQGLIVQQTA